MDGQLVGVGARPARSGSWPGAASGSVSISWGEARLTAVGVQAGHQLRWIGTERIVGT
jgi:hypothetical protein